MTARPTRIAGTAIPRPFLVVVDVELSKTDTHRNEVCTRKTYDAARSVAISCRALFDSFFGEDADYFVMRVVDLRDYTVCFEYN